MTNEERSGNEAPPPNEAGGEAERRPAEPPTEPPAEPPARIHRRCPFCGADNGSRKSSPYSRDGWALKECPDCSFVYLENPPPYEALAEGLAWDKSYPLEAERRRARAPFLHRLDSLTRMLRWLTGRDKLIHLARRYFASGRVLDVGCGGGLALERLDERYIPHGIEISRRLHAEAQRRVAARGGRVVRADAISGLASFSDASFEGVIMCSYLEHEIDPLGALREARRVLKIGGRLIVKVPHFGSINRRVRGSNWCGFHFPAHVNYFDPAALRRTLERAGFRLLRFNFFDRLPISDSMWVVACGPPGE